MFLRESMLLESSLQDGHSQPMVARLRLEHSLHDRCHRGCSGRAQNSL